MFDYDYQNDNLFIYDPKSKSKASVEINDLIIDYNSKKDISAIELNKASQFFKDMDVKGVKINKKLLNNIKSCKLDILRKNSYLVIKIYIIFNNEEKCIAPIAIPSIAERSPAVASI